MDQAQDVLDRVWREQWSRLSALLVAATRRLDLVEDALADAFEQAARRWPSDGLPSNPAAWLLTSARRRIIDRIRAEAIHAVKHRQLASSAPTPPDVAEVALADADADVLRLVLLAAHPSLSLEAGAALTLRLVLGISTADIARLFLVSEPTMAARLTRAKKKVIAAGIPLALPDEDVLPGRLDTIAQVAYLVFTAGYAPGSGEHVVRTDLAEQGLRIVQLTRSVSAAARSHPTLIALEALIRLQHSRRDARSGPDGDLVLLADQDRSQWHTDEIAAGVGLLEELLGQAPGRFSTTSQVAASYVVQALIAREHTAVEGPDWTTVADLYGQLDELTGAPVVRMNRAVAVAESGDLPLALTLLDGCATALQSSHRYWAVRAELLTRHGQLEDATHALTRAVELCGNEPERRLLSERLDALRAR